MRRGRPVRMSSASSTFCHRKAERTMPASVKTAATTSHRAVPTDHSGTRSPASNDGTLATSTASIRALTTSRTPNDTACLRSTPTSVPCGQAGRAPARPGKVESTAASSAVPRALLPRSHRCTRRHARPDRPTARATVACAFGGRGAGRPVTHLVTCPHQTPTRRRPHAPRPHPFRAVVHHHAGGGHDRGHDERRRRRSPRPPARRRRRSRPRRPAGGVRARAESDMSEVAAALEAAGQQLDGDWSRPAAIVVDGDTVFSQLGPMADALGRSPDDRARARLSDVAGPASVADNDTLALALDPLGPLDLLRRPVVEIRVVGAEEVRGTPTRHLRAQLDLTGAGAGPGGDGRAAGAEAHGGDVGPTGTGAGADDAADTAAGGNGEAATNGRSRETTGRNGVPVNGGSGAAPRGGVPADPPAGSFEARLVAAGFASLPVDVWLDGQGAIRRLVVTVEGAGSVTTTFEVFDIGGDVQLATP